MSEEVDVNADVEVDDIDPNTGLPTLPEGYFWRVTEAVRNGFSIHRIMVVKRVLKKGHVTVEKTRTVPGTWATFWRDTVETYKDHELQEIESTLGLYSYDLADITRLVRKSDKEDPVTLDGYTKQDLLDLNYEFCSRDKFAGETYIRVWEFSEESILKGARLLKSIFMKNLEKEAKEKEENERFKSLLGDYPPKVIGSAAGSVEDKEEA